MRIGFDTSAFDVYICEELASALGRLPAESWRDWHYADGYREGYVWCWKLLKHYLRSRLEQRKDVSDEVDGYLMDELDHSLRGRVERTVAQAQHAEGWSDGYNHCRAVIRDALDDDYGGCPRSPELAKE